MKTYVMTTGAIFGLVVVLHVWRAIAEGSRIATDPWFIVITALAAGLCFWSFYVLRKPPSSTP